MMYASPTNTSSISTIGTGRGDGATRHIQLKRLWSMGIGAALLDTSASPLIRLRVLKVTMNGDRSRRLIRKPWPQPMIPASASASTKAGTGGRTTL